MTFGTEENRMLDQIIERRRTVRAFKDDIPAKEDIEAVIHAGLWAPFAGLAIADEKNFRKFFVVRQGSPLLPRISDLIKKQSRFSLEELERTIAEKPFLKEKAKGYMARISSMAEKGFPELAQAPCLIIVAEQKGTPPAEKQSLAHVIQNMWLKATALGLGLRLVSVIESLGAQADFSILLGLNHGEYAYTACILGHAAQEPQPGKRPADHDATRWL
jgi:nitroreductase